MPYTPLVSPFLSAWKWGDKPQVFSASYQQWIGWGTIIPIPRSLISSLVSTHQTSSCDSLQSQGESSTCFLAWEAMKGYVYLVRLQVLHRVLGDVVHLYLENLEFEWQWHHHYNAGEREVFSVEDIFHAKRISDLPHHHFVIMFHLWVSSALVLFIPSPLVVAPIYFRPHLSSACHGDDFCLSHLPPFLALASFFNCLFCYLNMSNFSSISMNLYSMLTCCISPLMSPTIFLLVPQRDMSYTRDGVCPLTLTMSGSRSCGGWHPDLSKNGNSWSHRWCQTIEIISLVPISTLMDWRRVKQKPNGPN